MIWAELWAFPFRLIRNTYTVSFQDNAVNWFDRNTSTGVLTYGGTLKDGLNGVDGLEEAHNVLVSADGNYGMCLLRLAIQSVGSLAALKPEHYPMVRSLVLITH